MKLIGFVLAASSIGVYASTSAQVTVNVRNGKIENVLKNISKQTGVRFIYEEGLLKDRKTSLDLKNVTLNASLNIIFSKSNYSYRLHGNTVVIKSKTEASLKEATQDLIMKGRVIDENSLPLANVTVTEVGTSTSVQTDVNGNFTLKVSHTSAKIRLNIVGFDPQTITYSNAVVSVKMVSSSNQMDEVVVVGFGKQKKESVVGAISSVSSKDLKVPTSTLSNAFAGRVAGIIAVQRGGEPGADGSNFWVRGISTFAGPSNPLIFIDGIESSITDMNNLPPEVIDNFSLLKDASATALYGARGANGVLMITTKRGGNFEKARINFRIENTFAAPTKPVKFSNAVDYMETFNYALTNRGLAPRFSDEKITNTQNHLDPVAYPDVDWYKTLFKDMSLNQYANFNVAGGGNRADYFVSANFNNDNGFLRKDPFNKFDNNIKIRKYNVLANVGVSLSNTTKAIIRVNSRLDDYNGSGVTSSELYGRLFLAPPALFPAVLPANAENTDHIMFGNLNGGPIPSGTGNNIYYNPYANMVSGYRSSFTATNMGAIEVNQDLKFLLDGLHVKGLLSFTNVSTSSNVRSSSPFYYEVSDFKEVDGKYDYTYRNVTRGTTALSSNLTSEGSRLMNVNFVVDYTKQIKSHKVGGMLAYLSRDYNPNNPSSFVASLPTRNQGIAGRLTYGYNDTYFFEGNFGYNGSEAFAKGKRFGFFPSLAAGYMISNESFWQPLKPVISSLKFRGSWGIVGNANVYSSAGSVVRFPYLEEVNLNGRGYTFGNNWQTTQTGAAISKLGYPGATWERGKKINVGMDLGMFKDKFTLTADWFTETRSDIFMQRQVVPAEVGVVGLTPYANIGQVSSSGVDGNLSYQQQLTPDLYLNVRGTFTYSKNTLLDRDEPTQLFAYQSAIGRPLNVGYGYTAEGYYQDATDIATSPVNTLSKDLKPGDIKYKDLNADGKIDAFDKSYIGNPTVPQIVYGIGGSARYKKVDFSVFFQGTAKVSLFMSGIHPFNPESSALLQYIADDYWTENNTDAMYPRTISNLAYHSNFETSTHWMRDASFIRLKNAEVGFTHKFARVFVAGQNLVTFSKFKYWDVELGGGNGLKYPNNRIVSVGGQFNF
ncbi:SusC/RagA family TonB-linked outer membrane protein [Sphingobacterium athyrii]|nr:SusC/RagA family TonB-linked outer membrane protein [Sphingobacterium athyrii]